MDDQPQSLYPYFGYRDGPAALAFLEQGLGFERVTVQEADDSTILHSELRFANGVILMGSYTEEQLQDDPKPPRHSGVYVLVDDVDERFERATSAGAEVVYPPEDTEWGTRRARLRDPEGYEWTLGTYAPGQSWE